MRVASEALPMTSAYFSLILREHGTDARDRAALLAGTGAGREGALEAPGEITLGQQLRQVRNASRLLGPGWALATGSRLHAATHGALGVGAVSAPTVRRGLEVMTRFSQVRAPHFRLVARDERDVVRLVPEDRVELDDEERIPLLDIVLLSTQGLVEALLGRPLHDARFEVSYARPAYASRYADHFHAPVRFGCTTPAVVLPAAWLDVECPLADGAMFEASLASLTDAARRFAGRCPLVARAEHLVAAHGERLSFGAAARALRLSRRTLSRRLHEEGTSWRALLDARKKARAARLLRDPELGFGDVAAALGFDDTANFGRACRRWFGMSPGAYRRRAAALG